MGFPKRKSDGKWSLPLQTQRTIPTQTHRRILRNCSGTGHLHQRNLSKRCLRLRPNRHVNDFETDRTVVVIKQEWFINHKKQACFHTIGYDWQAFLSSVFVFAPYEPAKLSVCQMQLFRHFFKGYLFLVPELETSIEVLWIRLSRSA